MKRTVMRREKSPFLPVDEMSKTNLLLGGLKSFLPRRRSYSMSSCKSDVRYGYSVWLRHVVTLANHGVRGPFRRVVELGPGNSFATGISAVLSGTDQYIGLDVLSHLAPGNGIDELDDIVSLFRTRSDVPQSDSFAAIRPRLDNYSFPASALVGIGFETSTDERRVVALRRSLERLALGGDGDDTLRYVVPWGPDSVPDGSVDLIFSQAVLQEIPHAHGRSALRETIATTARWLRPGGVAAHQIDFGMYQLEPWNVHWTWSDATWRLVRGRRDNFVNREPLSTYTSLARECGLSLLGIQREEMAGSPDSELNRRFSELPEEERRTRSAFVIMQRKA